MVLPFLYHILYHLYMKAHKCNNEFVNILLTKLSIENKPTIIAGDFNLNLIKYLQNRGINQFREDLISNNFIPPITLPTSLTEKTQQH